MTSGSDDRHEMTDEVWKTDDESGALAFDEECSPTRVCRNAREFSFDGIAEDGGDLKTAWRQKLEREGKLDSSAESIRDLVLGQSASD